LALVFSQRDSVTALKYAVSVLKGKSLEVRVALSKVYFSCYVIGLSDGVSGTLKQQTGVRDSTGSPVPLLRSLCPPVSPTSPATPTRPLFSNDTSKDAVNGPCSHELPVSQTVCRCPRCIQPTLRRNYDILVSRWLKIYTYIVACH
jgi:hypothetical protein